MVSATPAPLSETLATPLGLGIAVYLLIGFVVVFYVLFRCSWLRRPPSNTVPWERRENPQQGLNLFFMVGSFHPVVFIIQLLLWPLWVLFLWAFQADDDNDKTI